ncbi:hypothetical protein D5S18_23435 [Nocardia panacis]|uniref:Rv3651-like N-terminal domain-containing protein n=1 Tax=Nocardia panacis TaxID=2340916 RepID=A0A3A4KQI2_9NOCA|nr:GAF domain-containing protein [Nocardia panacis]RJO72127.1 hypothetical protein D5S18_23435 [Nocardia panacis]
MLTRRWLLIETLGRAESWSVVASGSRPRAWTSFRRAVPARLQPIIAAAHAGGVPLDQVLPQSRHAWSALRLLVIPVLGMDGRVCALRVWVGTGEPPQATGVAPFRIDAVTRRVDTLPDGLGPHFRGDPISWLGAQSYATVERFDGALEFAATLARSAPDSRWLGTATVRGSTGPRSVLIAARNGDAPATTWFGVAVDVTESVPPQPKSFEASTLDLLRAEQPGLYLAIVDTARVRLIRWVSEPLPGPLWSVPDERTLPHPADRTRILAARNAIRAGTPHTALAGIRLRTGANTWLTVDVEITPIPGGTPGAQGPEFALLQMEAASPFALERPEPPYR